MAVIEIELLTAGVRLVQSVISLPVVRQSILYLEVVGAVAAFDEFLKYAVTEKLEPSLVLGFGELMNTSGISLF